MTKSSATTNAGVHGSTGFEFQKHCALWLLFENYTEISGKKYFICIEHHDDFLFCFLDDAGLIVNIEAFQAKKASSAWSNGVVLSAILKKLTQTGLDLLNDTHPKQSNYLHTLSFVTNDSISLNCGSRKTQDRKTLSINESNHLVTYDSIDDALKQNILKGLSKEQVTASNQIRELDKLSFFFIDLPKTNKAQKDTLAGQISRTFGDRVADPKAALDTLLLLFRNIEYVLNSGNTARLMDKTKRVEGAEIAKAMQIITLKAKAYELWRKQGDNLAIKLQIGVFDQKKFEFQFQSSFDFFKDLSQAEHIKLRNYVQQNKNRWASFLNDAESIHHIYERFINENNTLLNDFDCKAAICAAYVELKG
ncbi:hypothetical protein A4D02_35835 [Niastella koreensis]|uniref:CD-NTase associated protein 4-like DNA endonuclease domain-containing protein n=2 Tax=Niastella koreensis TaxID=354356 RepID=G8T908_NIAKG|nr:dsDNA nuclease domain-containing protein [Niastella koreensis]AEW02365.1 hypothetical protein Niako_6140 [Niastella koreensis GR20-10]OQP43416.1 hypothetical protein A4D02_35835 [Niastella koreensis]